jgi:hypothetical protein
MDPMMNSSVARHLAQALAGSGLTVVALSACSGLGFGHTAADHAAAGHTVAGHTVAGHPSAVAPDRPAATAAPSASATPAPGAPVLAAATSAYTGPHFGTPQAAMSYLTGAYNGDDPAALHAVTTPQAFRQLTAMRSEAVNLQLQSCVPSGSGRGDYVCTFGHDYPASLHQSGHGSSRILVAPAENPGWYMYTLLECG